MQNDPGAITITVTTDFNGNRMTKIVVSQSAEVNNGFRDTRSERRQYI